LAAGGTISGSVSVQSGGVLNNAGTLNGSLSISSASTVNNYSAGVMNAVGALTVPTNAVLNNAGVIYGTTVNVSLGGTLSDTYSGSTGQSPGSLNVVSLTIAGTFKPGGGSINTTKVTDYSSPSNPQLNPNGRLLLASGSTTYLEVNMDNPAVQTNSLVLAQNQGFGASQAFKAFNGGKLVITNLGSTHFAAGQQFKFFGNYVANSDCGTAGLNTTNAYPFIVPAVPGPGLVWDLSQLISQGYIGVLSASDPSLFFSITNSAFTFSDGTNSFVVNQLTWPTNKIGGWVQQLKTTLTNGLSATNWASLNGNYGATNDGIQIMSQVNTWYITNTVVADPTAPGSAVFYRFVYP
jgi:hypothetical protein